METDEIESIASHAVEFQPRRFIINGHLQTIMGNYLPRINGLPTPEATLVEVSPATSTQIASQVLCHCHWQPEEVRASRPTAILVHGLEGSSNSQYVIGNSNKLWRAGCNIIRMNMRNCGGTEALSPTLYHSGLSNDVLEVMNFFVAQHGLQSLSLIGYSMGGNLVLKLAGELGTSAPPELRSVIGVSPALDLGASADALHRPQNRLYELKFLRALLLRYRRKVALFPHVYDPNLATGIRSLRELDDRITALYSGFTGSDDYYYRAAAARVIDHIAVPTLILHALDDPFVRITEESCSRLEANPNIHLITTHHGGHCAFLAQPDADTGYDGYWAEHTLLRFLLANASVALPTSAHQ
ncbi:alpha/beta fold hydrolase [Tunturibacter psychrotolerans]|uniref:Alpha/beta fold hydrolase n=1 Tax=Tunturiibacter psychrotolerans TaxID=3069686 RepID=A0AAU7ZTY8_9BACT